MMTTLLLMGCVAVVASIAMKNPKVRPVEFPFAAKSADPSADTMVNQSQIETVFADTGWQSVTVDNLSHVEEMLDRLEACQVGTREVVTLANASFCVRWR